MDGQYSATTETMRAPAQRVAFCNDAVDDELSQPIATEVTLAISSMHEKLEACTTCRIVAAAARATLVSFGKAITADIALRHNEDNVVVRASSVSESESASHVVAASPAIL